MLSSLVVAALVAGPVRVAMFDGPGVAEKGFRITRELLTHDPRFDVQTVDADQIRAGVLEGVDAVVFMGGDGARQGKALGVEGRARVRELVERGGGYMGVCAGAYLAMQGPARFHKIALVAARNLSGVRWKRGVAAVDVEAVGSSERLELHFANGPLFARATIPGMPPYVTVARFRSDLHRQEHGTEPGEMPGTPAIVVSAHGRGRVLLFSPHPGLARPGRAHPELLFRGLLWAAAGGPVPEATTFGDVFDG